MKNYFFSLSILLSSLLRAQQNFINVPSGEVTKKGKLFFQQQININNLIQSNSTVDIGLGKDIEMGINLLGVNFDDKIKSFQVNDTSNKDPYNPLLMLNGLKQFKITDHIETSTGIQTGLNFNDNKKTTLASLGYANLMFKDYIKDHSIMTLGIYYNSLHYGGDGNRFGGWIGTEFPITQRFHVMGESVIGTNAICYTSLGIVLYVNPHVPLTVGVQIPNNHNNNSAFVFEFTFVP